MFYDNIIRDGKAFYNIVTQVRETKFFLNHTQIPSKSYFAEELTDRMFPDYSKYNNYYEQSLSDVIAIHGHIPIMQLRVWNNQEKVVQYG